MSKESLVLIVGCVLAFGLAATGFAQAPEPGNTVLVAEFECAPGELARVDELIRDLAAPVLNKFVREGKLISWGLLGAYVGGPANRTIFVWGQDPVALLQARAEYLPEIGAKPGWSELGRLCPVQQVRLSNMLLRSEAPQ